MTTPPGGEVTALGPLFRREAGRLVAAVTRVFGLHNLALAEDVVQDALCQALETWKLRGLPENPSAWLLTAARNRAIDVLRREKRARGFAPDLSRLLESEWTLVPTVTELFRDELIADDQLRMMFSCCHPKLGDDARVSVILSLLCGFGSREIAAAFLTGPAATEKRVQRAKRTLAASGHLFEVASAADVRARLADVLGAVYLLFNEGYHGGGPGARTVREELCAEAIRLALLLAEHRATRGPETLAFAALLHLHAARLPGRMNEAGELASLEEQDRTKWDRPLIQRGLGLLDASTVGDELTAYHIEAAIAAEHATAACLADTNWTRIAALYDTLLALSPSPVVALSRAVALGQAHGPARGLAELGRLASDPRLARYPFFEAAIGDLQLRSGQREKARAHFERAAVLARGPLERRFLLRRAKSCGGPA